MLQTSSKFSQMSASRNTPGVFAVVIACFATSELLHLQKWITIFDVLIRKTLGNG